MNTGTRFFNPDDWGLDWLSFFSIICLTGVSITVDLFAHLTIGKTECFYSFGHCSQSMVLDAFTQDWTGKQAWICLPVSLVIPALLKLCATKKAGIFIMPCWRSAAFWNFIFPNGTHALLQCWKIESIFPHIVIRKYCYNPLMQGSIAFPFLVIHLISAGLGYTCPRHLMQ